jgi:hypothetical protein
MRNCFSNNVPSTALAKIDYFKNHIDDAHNTHNYKTSLHIKWIKTKKMH